MMSTQSIIALEFADGTIKGIHCHNNSYIQDGVGEELFYDYNSAEKLLDLLEEGDRFTLKGGEACKDRGDPWDQCKPITYANRQEVVDNMQRYLYLYTNEGRWLVAWGGSFAYVYDLHELAGHFTHRTPRNVEQSKLRKRVLGLIKEMPVNELDKLLTKYDL